MNNPEFAKIGDKKYKINIDFRIAIECNEIAQDDTIKDTERALAIIYKLYGDEGLDNPQDYEKLLEIAIKFLTLGKNTSNDNSSNEEIDMDFVKDMDYIEASFMSDYKIDLSETKMHWYKFYNLLEGLSNSDIGNCCVLNRVRNLRNFDVSKIKDSKEREKMARAKEMVSLNKKLEVHLTKEQEESMEQLNKIIGFKS